VNRIPLPTHTVHHLNEAIPGYMSRCVASAYRTDDEVVLLVANRWPPYYTVETVMLDRLEPQNNDRDAWLVRQADFFTTKDNIHTATAEYLELGGE